METTLSKFIKDNCAYYDRHYRECLNGGVCKVLAGQRCGYFERAVLGPPDYKYRLPGYDYSKLFAQYAEITKTKAQRVKVRRCECGAPLQYRHRYCERCAARRKKEATRKRQQKFYQTYGNKFVKTIRGHLYRVFSGMEQRCNDSSNKGYKNYGGRGIQNKFDSFEEFYKYVIEELKVDPRGLTIDRIDNDGHYEKGNIRFVSQAENIRNSRVCKKNRNHKLTVLTL